MSKLVDVFCAAVAFVTPGSVKWMRDKRTPKDVCGEARLRLYIDEYFETAYFLPYQEDN